MNREGGDRHDQGLGLLTTRLMICQFCNADIGTGPHKPWCPVIDRPLRARIPGAARLLAMVADELYDRPRPPGPLWPRERCGR
jgi:hypothetical protein